MLRRSQRAVAGPWGAFGDAGAIPQGLKATPVRRAAGSRAGTLGKGVFLSAPAVSRCVLVTVQTGSVHAQVTGVLTVTGVTGPAPRPQLVTGFPRPAVLEAASQGVGVGRVGVAGPAGTLPFAQVR